MPTPTPEKDYIRGEKSLLYIKRDDLLVPVACLTSNPISEESEMMETTIRNNKGWKTSVPTLQSYSIAVAGLAKITDSDGSAPGVFSYRELRKLKRDRTLFDWVIKTLNGWYVDAGRGYINSISYTDTASEYITFTATITGYGAPEEGRFVPVLSTHDKVLINDNKQTLLAK